MCGSFVEFLLLSRIEDLIEPEKFLLIILSFDGDGSIIALNLVTCTYKMSYRSFYL